METQDLKIGNLGQDREGRLCQVEQLSIGDEPRISAIKGGLTSLPVKPIPLTEEWLMKLGFENKERQKWHKEIVEDEEYFGVWICKHPHKENCFHLFGYPYRIVVIEHVHQLQNLYHALTGEELPTPTK